MVSRFLLPALALSVGIAAPASASWWSGGAVTPPAKPPVTSTKVPEPADIVLFAAGVAGLLLGRRGSRSRRNKD